MYGYRTINSYDNKYNLQSFWITWFLESKQELQVLVDLQDPTKVLEGENWLWVTLLGKWGDYSQSTM